jgi:diguanylate cyclase (GGDEF)-like protein/PAS domain S-box-containing protein
MVDDPLFYKKLLDSLQDGIYFVDPDRRITYWNKGAERISGYSASDMVGSRCRDNLLMHIDEHGQPLCGSRCPLAATMLDGGDRQAEVLLHHRDGHRVPVLVRASPIRDANGGIIGAVEVFSEKPLRDDLHRRIEELKTMAFLDVLTDVPNRRYLELVIRSKLQEHAEHGFPLGLLFVDIDRFKEINDRLGHEAGDRALRMVAQTLAANLRPLDVVGRWGGEEFLVLLPNIGEGMDLVADRLRVFVERSSLDVAGEVLCVTVSIGGTLARPEDTLQAFVQRADEAMYRSKTAGRNRVAIS